MKRCPECRRDYYDETLSYCLADGAELVYGLEDDEPATAILRDTARRGEEKTRPFEPVATTATVSRRNSIIVGTLGIVLVTVLGIASYWYFGRASSKQIDSIAVMWGPCTLKLATTTGHSNTLNERSNGASRTSYDWTTLPSIQSVPTRGLRTLSAA